MVVASLIIVALSPVFALVAAAIFIEDGRPIFFLQERVGRHREPFMMWKFRSMVDGADENLHRLHTEQVMKGTAPLRTPRRSPHHPGGAADPQVVDR